MIMAVKSLLQFLLQRLAVAVFQRLFISGTFGPENTEHSSVKSKF